MLGLRYEMDDREMTRDEMEKKIMDMIEEVNKMNTSEETSVQIKPHPWKYNEGKIVNDLWDYLKSTYSEHYAVEDEEIQCFDAWIAMGDATPTFRNTAIKYLWRYGKKNGNNKKDLMKALHYIVLCLHNDHYRGKP